MEDKILLSPEVLELNSSNDIYMTLKMIILTTKVNLNNARFTEDFIDGIIINQKKYHGIGLVVNRVKLENEVYDNLTHEFDGWELKTDMIGSFVSFEKQYNQDGSVSLIGEARVLKRFPKTCEAIMDLYSQEKLRFSCEAIVRIYADSDEEGIRVIPYADGVNSLIGNCIVSSPAEVSAKATLLVASYDEDILTLNKSDTPSDLDIETNGGANMEELQAKVDELTKLIEDKDVEINSLKEQVEKAEIAEEIKELNGKIEELNGLVVSQKEEIVGFENKIQELNSTIEELTPFKEQVETAEKLAKKNALLEKFTKLVSKETAESERFTNAIEEGNEIELNSIVVEEVSKNVKVEVVTVVAETDDVVIATAEPKDLIPGTVLSKYGFSN